MTGGVLLGLCAAIAVVAFLYSAVGHAGASGYIAVMTLFGVAAATVKPAALVLNILVACLATWQYGRAGYFSWALFWPFAVLSVPLAFLGGYVNLPTHWFKVLIGLVLLFSAARFVFGEGKTESDEVAPPGRATALCVGGGIGLLSGLTGTGGGIFLTPIMIFLRWARMKPTAAVSALFILVNSIAGLLGNFSSTRRLPLFALPLVAAALVGGGAGSYLGARSFSPVFIKRLLALVLLIAGLKLMFA